MPVADAPPAPEQSEAEEVERLIALAAQGQLAAAAQRRVAPLLRTLIWLHYTLLETRISLAKLKRLLFGKPTEKAPRQSPPDPATDPGNGEAAASGEAKAANAIAPLQRQRHPDRPRRGGGR
jgi:hypothetical protein